MAMQLGSAGNMFGTPNPGNEALAWQENARQNQEMSMRQQALQAQLQSQALQNEQQQLNNQFNRDSYQTRLEGLAEQLTSTKLDNATRVQEAMFKPRLWNAQLTHMQNQDDALKQNIKLAQESASLDRKKFDLSKKLADAELEDKQIAKPFRMLQLGGAIQEQQQKIEMGAAQLKQQALQNELARLQVNGFDATNTLDRFRAYQQMDPAMRKVAKKHLPDLYGDLPDQLEEDNIRKMGTAISVLRFLKEDPAMALMNKVDPAQNSLKNAAMKLLGESIAPDNNKSEKALPLQDAMKKLVQLTSRDEKRREGSARPANDADTVERLEYHFSQHKAESNRPYNDMMSRDALGYTNADEENEFVGKSPLGKSVSSAGRYSTEYGKGKIAGWFKDGGQIRFSNPSLPKEVRKDFEYAIGTKAASSGTNKQVTAFRSLISELSDALESGDKEAGKDIIEKYGRFGPDIFTDTQKQAIKNLIYKFGWSE